MLDPHVAVHRFGLGARPGEAAALGPDPAAALLAQLRAGAPIVSAVELQPTPKIYVDFREFRRRRHERKRGVKLREIPGGDVNINVVVPHAEFAARLDTARDTQNPFAERMVLFFANHFVVSSDRLAVRALTGAFERDAIRPHVAGTFRAMLGAATRHPAMLTYLSNGSSMGPNSRRGLRQGRGVNENLARELLELHTLGVDGGYSQADVGAVALALTGWGVGAEDDPEPGRFLFDPSRHEPGPKTILGRTFPEDGEREMEAVLDMLAAHPATARHLARRLAIHFVSDDPPQELVDALAARFLDSGGDLVAVAEVLLTHPASAVPEAQKMRPPIRFVLAAVRAFEAAPAAPRTWRELVQLGQKPFEPGSPKGWDDLNRAWLGSRALHVRLDWANAFAARYAPEHVAPELFARELMGARLSDETRSALRGAESPLQAYTILLMSPEFQKA